jgi:hypothetical protein
MHDKSLTPAKPEPLIAHDHDLSVTKNRRAKRPTRHLLPDRPIFLLAFSLVQDVSLVPERLADRPQVFLRVQPPNGAHDFLDG